MISGDGFLCRTVSHLLKRRPPPLLLCSLCHRWSVSVFQQVTFNSLSCFFDLFVWVSFWTLCLVHWLFCLFFPNCSFIKSGRPAGSGQHCCWVGAFLGCLALYISTDSCSSVCPVFSEACRLYLRRQRRRCLCLCCVTCKSHNYLLVSYPSLFSDVTQCGIFSCCLFMKFVFSQFANTRNISYNEYLAAFLNSLVTSSVICRALCMNKRH